MTASCAACDGPGDPRGRPWCSRACRGALRRYGSALAPTATRQQQVAAALAQRAAMAGMEIALDPSWWEQRGLR